MKWLRIIPITFLAAIGLSALTEGRSFIISLLYWVVYLLAIQFVLPDD